MEMVVTGNSLTAETHERLRNEIIHGLIRPNERLVAVDLADRLDVSRTPVREALQLLASEGLIVPARRGYAVREHTVEEIREVYEVRAVLDGLAARLAAERSTAEQIRHLKSIRAHTAGALDDKRQVIVDRNDAFHEAITAISGNARLALINERNSRQFFTYRVAQQYTTDEAIAALEEHALILDAIVRRDPDAADRHAQAHVRGALAITLSKISSRSGPAPARKELP